MHTSFHVRAGRVIGRDHMLRQANCQDSYAVVEQPASLVAIVCDGSGSGRYSEFGSLLGAQYVAARAAEHLQANVAPDELPALLHRQIVTFLGDLRDLVQTIDPLAFVREHLLFTILGVAIKGGAGVIFSAGDGTVILDDEVNLIDQNNTPQYIAYHLLSAAELGDYTPASGFAVLPLASGWQRLAIASDGFEPELAAHLWGQVHPLGLQRKLNGWSNSQRRFRDDATVIAIEQLIDKAAHSDSVIESERNHEVSA